MNTTGNIAPTPRTIAQQKYNVARTNLILMIGLTVINIILALVGSDTMLLFSATVPYFATVFATMAEFQILFASLVAIAVLSVLCYLVCWIFSKKHFGWMIAALVLFVLDTLALIAFYLVAGEISGILDLAIHAWVLYYLILGVINGAKLKTLPEEVNSCLNGEPAGAQAPTVSPIVDGVDTPILRVADMTVKSRILVQTDAFGHHIVFRRVKRINELVIDGNVYADVEILIETAHALSACIDGHLYQVGFDGVAHCYICVDGNQIAKKLRLI